jgi:hypothetical protein
MSDCSINGTRPQSMTTNDDSAIRVVESPPETSTKLQVPHAGDVRSSDITALYSAYLSTRSITIPIDYTVMIVGETDNYIVKLMDILHPNSICVTDHGVIDNKGATGFHNDDKSIYIHHNFKLVICIHNVHYAIKRTDMKDCIDYHVIIPRRVIGMVNSLSYLQLARNWMSNIWSTYTNKMYDIFDIRRRYLITEHELYDHSVDTRGLIATISAPVICIAFAAFVLRNRSPKDVYENNLLVPIATLSGGVVACISALAFYYTKLQMEQATILMSPLLAIGISVIAVRGL